MSHDKINHFKRGQFTFDVLTSWFEPKNPLGSRLEIHCHVPYKIVFLRPGDPSTTIQRVQQLFAQHSPSNFINDSITPVWNLHHGQRYVEVQQDTTSTIHRQSTSVVQRQWDALYDYLIIDGFPSPGRQHHIRAPWKTCYGGPPAGGSIVLVARDLKRFTLVRGLAPTNIGLGFLLRARTPGEDGRDDLYDIMRIMVDLPIELRRRIIREYLVGDVEDAGDYEDAQYRQQQEQSRGAKEEEDLVLRNLTRLMGRQEE